MPALQTNRPAPVRRHCGAGVPPAFRPTPGLLHPRHGTTRGVTFMELMIVILIMIMMAGIGIPTMMGVYRRSQLSSAARELTALTRLARQRAVLTGHHTEVLVDTQKGTYRLNLTPEDPHDRYRGSSDAKSIRSMERTRKLAEGNSRVHFQSANSAMGGDHSSGSEPVKILFYRNGTATPATIVLVDDAKRLMTIQVIGATGDVRMGPGPPEALIIPVVTPAPTAVPAATPSAAPTAAPAAAAPASGGGGVRIKNRGQSSTQ